jgi:hypothetical protein
MLGQVRTDEARLGVVWLGYERLGEVRIDKARLGHVRRG